MRAVRLVTALIAAAMVVAAPAHAAEPRPSAPGGAVSGGDWHFTALLDGKPIGKHRFSVSARGGERTVQSDADFNVTFIGISAYRYRHRDTEQWRGECLSAMSSTTDDDGKKSSVEAQGSGHDAGLTIKTPRGSEPVTGCLMSFAYWNPLIEHQTRLLNAQTGVIEQVQVSRAERGTIEVRGQSVAATRWRITGPAQPVDLWYSERGDWIGLDSTVAGGRKLTYRLQ